MNPEDGSSTVLRNVGIQPPHCTAQEPAEPLDVCPVAMSKLWVNQKLTMSRKWAPGTDSRPVNKTGM